MANWKRAEEIMVDIDRSDIPFVAAALSLLCDGIWSDDADLKRQKRVKVWNTKEDSGSSDFRPAQGSLRLRRDTIRALGR